MSSISLSCLGRGLSRSSVTFQWRTIFAILLWARSWSGVIACPRKSDSNCLRERDVLSLYPTRVQTRYWWTIFRKGKTLNAKQVFLSALQHTRVSSSKGHNNHWILNDTGPFDEKSVRSDSFLSHHVQKRWEIFELKVQLIPSERGPNGTSNKSYQEQSEESENFSILPGFSFWWKCIRVRWTTFVRV